MFTGSDTGYASDPTSTYPGDQIQSWFGTGLGAGDVNDDGSPDLAVGANEYDGTYSDGGRSFVFMNACAEKVPSLNSTPAQPCVGDSVLLDAGSGYNSYAWSNGDSGQVLEVELMDTSIYSVQTVGDSGCVTQNDTVLAPNSLPSPQFMGLDTAYCLKDTIYQLSASPSGGSFNGPGLGSGGAFDPQNAGMGIHTISYSYTDSNGCSGTTDTNIQVVDCATSLNSHGVEEALIIRPNPSEGRVVIDHPGNSSWKLTIRDMQGKELKVFQMPSGEKRTRLDLSALPDGVHFLHFRATEGVKIRKLLLR